ncbi:hypothetical protein ACIRQF_31465 [Streptomyces sp. NPDC101191]|uniref:hypothetical protein n=1 Tax=Streptomyces sp. NPDC101191 TaxID=3366126 RepID=UPI0038169A05
MTHAEDRDQDRLVRQYMAEHPGMRYNVARRAVAQQTSTAATAQPAAPGPTTEATQELGELMARLRAMSDAGDRTLPGKTHASFDMGRHAAALYGNRVRIIDVDSAFSAPPPAVRQDYTPVIIDCPPSSPLPAGGGAWEEALSVMGLPGGEDRTR